MQPPLPARWRLPSLRADPHPPPGHAGGEARPRPRSAPPSADPRGARGAGAGGREREEPLRAGGGLGRRRGGRRQVRAGRLAGPFAITSGTTRTTPVAAPRWASTLREGQACTPIRRNPSAAPPRTSGQSTALERIVVFHAAGPARLRSTECTASGQRAGRTHPLRSCIGQRKHLSDRDPARWCREGAASPLPHAQPAGARRDRYATPRTRTRRRP